MRRLTILLFILTLGVGARSQDKWTLEECLNYARENNIALKRQQVQSDMYKNDLRASQANLLPNLNFQSQGSMNFGRSVDPETNTITFNQNMDNYYYIGSNMTLFNGFSGVNRMAASKFLYLMGIELEQKQEDLLSLDIINAYYQILMSSGVVETAANQLEVSRQQLHRTEVMVRTGGESRTTMMELQSQLSNSQLQLTQAINNRRTAVVNLRQLLQIDPAIDFDIDERSLLVKAVTVMETDVDSIYGVARSIMPGIAALEYQALARKKELAAAIGDATPEITLSAGWRTGYYNAMVEGVDPVPFIDQLKNNTNQFIQANLTIPIFNRWFNGKNIKRAKLSLYDSKLQLEQEVNTLYQQVNSSSLELSAIYDEYRAAKDNRDYSSIAFTAVEKKFQTGLANATEFAEAGRQKFYSEINLLRTELQYNLKLMTLNFYLTGTWDVGQGL